MTRRGILGDGGAVRCGDASGAERAGELGDDVDDGSATGGPYGSSAANQAEVAPKRRICRRRSPIKRSGW